VNLIDLIHRSATPAPWSEADTIPWSEPSFSKRMLQEHLSQRHDWASRRTEIIDAHVRWLHQHVLGGETGTILELGCGPGLYLSRLAAMGHRCTGIDFSPASVAYAREQAAEKGLDIDFREADIRTAPFPGQNDLVFLIFGEMNVFPQATAEAILARVRAALTPSGKLVIEVHRESALRRIGRQSATWSTHRSGLFAASPHLALEEYFWDETSATATRRSFIMEASGVIQRHAGSYQAYLGDDYRALLAKAGLVTLECHPSLSGDPAPKRGPCADLMVFVGGGG
jgi:SAM-dependent methyltransferase